jgi:hypothetical protein
LFPNLEIAEVKIMNGVTRFGAGEESCAIQPSLPQPDLKEAGPSTKEKQLEVVLAIN